MSPWASSGEDRLRRLAAEKIYYGSKLRRKCLSLYRRPSRRGARKKRADTRKLCV